MSFQFALREVGQARAEVFDARGRLVACVLDRQLGTGSFAASWNGRNAAGALASPGIYYLRLRLPGFTDSRRIVIAR